MDRPESRRTEHPNERAIRLTVENRCPTCAQPAGKSCVLPDGSPASSSCFERQLECRTAFTVIGPGRQTTYALAIWPADIVSRDTLRALLPTGYSKRQSKEKRQEIRRRGGIPGTANRVTETFARTLKKLEQDNLIKRGTEFVLIVDRRGLIDRAADGIPPNFLVHEKFLHIRKAAAIVEREILAETRERVRQQRESELAAIRTMMRNGENRDSRRRSVRHEAGQFAVPLGGAVRRHLDAVRDSEEFD